MSIDQINANRASAATLAASFHRQIEEVRGDPSLSDHGRNQRVSELYASAKRLLGNDQGAGPLIVERPDQARGRTAHEIVDAGAGQNV